MRRRRPCVVVPDLKAIVSASSADEVETKTTVSTNSTTNDDDAGNDELKTKTAANEVQTKIAEGDEDGDEVKVDTTASSARCEPMLRPATLEAVVVHAAQRRRRTRHWSRLCPWKEVWQSSDDNKDGKWRKRGRRAAATMRKAGGGND